MIQPLIVKYRPTEFNAVLGQTAIVASLTDALESGSSRAFILAGPSGTGKTTLARIIAAKVNADKSNIIEVDAASRTGIDDMRQLTSTLSLSALGDNPARVLIVDEAHALSKAAWQSLLKSIEEPPPHVYWCLCTTELGRIPATIQGRCAVYKTKLVPFEPIYKLIRRVAKAEGWTVAPDVLQTIAESADGSPRRALAGLAQCHAIEDADEVARMMQSVGTGDDDTIELCRALVTGQTSWSKLSSRIRKLPEGTDVESVRRVVFDYVSKAAADTEGESKVLALLTVLTAFAEPYPANAGRGHLLLSIGRVLYATE